MACSSAERRLTVVRDCDRVFSMAAWGWAWTDAVAACILNTQVQHSGGPTSCSLNKAASGLPCASRPQIAGSVAQMCVTAALRCHIVGEDVRRPLEPRVYSYSYTGGGSPGWHKSQLSCMLTREGRSSPASLLGCNVSSRHRCMCEVSGLWQAWLCLAGGCFDQRSRRVRSAKAKAEG